MRVKDWRVGVLVMVAGMVRVGFGETAATRAVLPVYAVGAAVEVKSAGDWEKGKIVARDGDVYQVSYDRWKGNAFFDEWVTVDRIRKPGETREMPWAPSTPHGQKPSKEARDQALVNLGLANPGETPGQRKVEWAGAREVAVEGSGAFAADKEGAVKLTGSAVGLGVIPRGAAERLEMMLPTSGETGKVGLVFEDRGVDGVKFRLVMVDLKLGQAGTTVTLPAEEKPIALSADGKRVMLVSVDGSTGWNGDAVDVCAISGGAAKSMAMFTPAAGEDKEWRQVKWGAFVDGDHVLVETLKGKVSGISVAEMKGVYTAADSNMEPALSANRKYAAVSLGTGMAVVNALTGETVVSIPKVRGLGAVFSADGERLAICSTNRIRILNVGKNEWESDIYLPPKVEAVGVKWVAPNYLLLGGTYLVDIEKGVVLWRYGAPLQFSADALVEEMVGGKLWVAVTRHIGVGAQAKEIRSMVGVTLPDKAAVEMAKKLSMEELMAMRPGVKVSLDVQVGNEEGNAVVTALFTEQLKKSGMEVAEGQGIRVTARVEGDKSHEISYQKSGSFERTKVSVQDQKVSAAVTVDGKEAWVWSTIVAAPMMVSMKEGETVEQAIAAQQGKAWRALEGVELPKRLAAPRETVGFGSSGLVEGGGR